MCTRLVTGPGGPAAPAVSGAAAGYEALENELRKSQGFANRMREALSERDRRMISLENQLADETRRADKGVAQIKFLEHERRKLTERVRDLERKVATSIAFEHGAASLGSGRYPGDVGAASLKQAHHEVVRLERERDEVAFMNGRLLNRLSDMQDSLGRLRRQLHVGHAAGQLSDAVSAADETRRLADLSAREMLKSLHVEAGYDAALVPVDTEGGAMHRAVPRAPSMSALRRKASRETLPGWGM